MDLIEEIAKAGLDRDIWQYFTVNTGVRSVGVMGDGRTYDYTIAIRAITSIDGMTADFAKIPWDVLQKISVTGGLIVVTQEATQQLANGRYRLSLKMSSKTTSWS